MTAWEILGKIVVTMIMLGVCAAVAYVQHESPGGKEAALIIQYLIVASLLGIFIWVCL